MKTIAPSKKIDALIAEHVLDWAWYSALGKSFLFPPHMHEYLNNFKAHWTKGFVEKRWYDDKRIKCEPSYGIELIYTDYKHCELPNFSKDISAAWQIIAGMEKKSFKEWLISNDEIYFQRGKLKEPDYAFGMSGNDLENIALNICIAALSALNIDLEKDIG